MKFSRTILSAVLLAGALALAGCGGGSDAPPTDTAEPSPVDLQTKAITDAIAAAETAVAAVGNASSDAQVMAADDAVAAANAAIAAGKDLTAGAAALHMAAVATLQDALDAAKTERSTLMGVGSSIAAATTAVGAVNNASSDDDVAAADAAVDAARQAIADAAGYLTASASNAHTATVDGLDSDLKTAKAVRTQTNALMTAAADIDTSDLSTAEAIGTANTAISALEAAIAAATDVADTSMYETQVSEAKSAVTTAQDALDTEGRRTAQQTALMSAAADIDTSSLDTQEAIDAAKMAIGVLEDAIAAANDVADTSMYETQVSEANSAVTTAQDALDTEGRRTAQRLNIDATISTAKAAVAMVKDDSGQSTVDAAADAVNAAEVAIAGAADVSAAEKAAYTTAVGIIEDQLDDAKESRTAYLAQKAKDDADKAATDLAAKIAQAKLMYDSIGAPGGTGADTRNAAYANNGANIAVTIGDEQPVNLSEDEKVTVAALGGWEGAKYTAAPTGTSTGAGNTYEAYVYSDIGAATEGRKFSVAYPYDAREVDGQNTELGINADSATDDAAVVALIDSSHFDQSAGSKEFELGDNEERRILSGTYHGVSGNYYCDPAENAKCTATVQSDGFTLTGGTWTFKATNSDDRLMDVDDTIYASYGWWSATAGDGSMNVSAFVSDVGDVPNAEIAPLRGKATYTGKAAGQYALHSATGGDNHSGVFSADATLDAKFVATQHTISGTIDEFKGADGGSLGDWTVDLNEANLASSGVIAAGSTKWKIDGEGATNGSWTGSLQDEGSDGVPRVATGTFYSEFDKSGKMVGAFGAKTD